LNKLNIINIPPSTFNTKTLFDKNKKNLYILFSVRYYLYINIKIKTAEIFSTTEYIENNIENPILIRKTLLLEHRKFINH